MYPLSLLRSAKKLHCASRISAVALISLLVGFGFGWARAQETGLVAKKAAEDPPSTILLRALELFRTKHFAEAAEAFARYLDSHPDSPEARQLLARCYLQLERPELALRELRQVAGDFPDDISVQQALRDAQNMLQEQQQREAGKLRPEQIQKWFVQAERKLTQKRLEEAEALLLQVLQGMPEHHGALQRLAEIDAETGRFLEAARLYERLLSLGNIQRKEPELRLARCLAWAQKYSAAIPHFGRYLELAPSDFGAHLELAEVYRWSGRPNEAIAHYQAVLQDQPGYVPGHLGLAFSYQDLDRHEEALREFDAALRVDPENEPARQARTRSLQWVSEERKRLALVAQEQENYGQAILLLREYAELRPDEVTVLFQLARLYSWSGDLPNARQYYERYLRQRPDDQAARLELGEVQNWQADYAEARGSFRQVLETQPENLRALVGMIRCYQWSGELDGVQPYLERLEQVQPGQPLVAEVRTQLALLRKQRLRERAERLEQDKDYVAAIAAYREYLSTYGPDPEIELRIPRLFAWNRQYREAIEEYRAFLVGHPEDRGVRLELAEVQRWNSNYADALENYSNFLAENPGHVRGLLGRAEALYAYSSDPFEVRKAYEQALRANPREALAVNRLREISSRLQPIVQIQTLGVFDSDGLERVVLQPRVTFFLPAGYRLVSLFQASHTHQARMLRGNAPAIVELNQHIAEHEGRLWGARSGLRVERQRSWGSWGSEAMIGEFSNNRLSVSFAGDVALRVSERDHLWSRYEHEEAGFELNTLASLAAGIHSDSWRLLYRHQFPNDFAFSAEYGITHFSGGNRFRFSDNLRNAAGFRVTYQRFRSFQPTYSYRVAGYRSVSPLYFSPGLYQVHRFEYAWRIGSQRALQFFANGSLGVGRIDATNTFEITVSPQLLVRLPRKTDLEVRYQFGQSRASSFGNANYRVHGFEVTFWFHVPGVRH